MAFENLTERERAILENLITHYIGSADPVGSRVIAQRYAMGLSPATIRNTLQDLEEMGLVSQPHISAGRIPTDSGYRFYVDFLLRPQDLSAEEKENIRFQVTGAGKMVDAILGQSSKMLAQITNEMGVTIAPRFDQGVLTRIQLLRLGAQGVLVALVISSGLAQSIAIEIEAAVGQDELTAIEAALNEKLTGLTLGEIRRTIGTRLANVEGNPRLLRILIDTNSPVWRRANEMQTHVHGAENLVRQPEFADREKLAGFVKAMQEPELLADALSNPGSSGGFGASTGVVITIGSENPISEIRDCSIVSAEYRVGETRGRVAVIGPRRMNYSKLVSLVEYTAKAVSEGLTLEGDTTTAS